MEVPVTFWQSFGCEVRIQSPDPYPDSGYRLLGGGMRSPSALGFRTVINGVIVAFSAILAGAVYKCSDVLTCLLNGLPNDKAFVVRRYAQLSSVVRAKYDWRPARELVNVPQCHSSILSLCMPLNSRLL